MDCSPTCSLHTDITLQYYCGDCEQTVCAQCVSADGAHSAHVVTAASAVIAKYDLRIRTTQQCIRDHLLRTTAAAATTTTIDGVCFTRLLTDVDAVIDACRAAVPSVLYHASPSQRKGFMSHIESLDGMIGHLVDRLERILTEEAAGLDVDSKPQLDLIEKQLKEMVNNGGGDASYSLEEQMERVEQLNETIRQLSKLVDRINCPLDVIADGKGLKRCQPDITTTIRLREKNDSPLKLEAVEATIQRLFADDERHVPKVRLEHQECLLLEYCLSAAGTYKLTISYRGVPLKGSPFLINCSIRHPLLTARTGNIGCVVHPDMKFDIFDPSARRTNNHKSDLLLKLQIGGKGKEAHQFTNPQSVCVGNDGQFIVADSQHQSVKTFTSDGRFLYQFGGRGRDAGQMQRPTGVAFDQRRQQILVADYDNKWINVFKENGRFIRRFGVNRLIGPKGILVSEHGEVVVVDNKASTVYVYDGGGGGQLLRQFGSRGEKPHQFAGPHYVAEGDSNQLFVSDFHHHCVKVFSSDGGYLGSIGSNGDGAGEFNAPTGVASHPTSGHLFVADWGNNRIQVFNHANQFVTVLEEGAGATASWPMYGPQGLTVTADHRLAVCDSGNQCVRVYDDMLI